MNLTLHLIRKDFRHLRLAMLFLGTLIVAQIIFTNRLLTADAGDSNWYMPMCGFVNLLYFLGLVCGYLVSGMIVLADAPAGSVSHWQTRPIAGGRLLVAKATVGVLLIGVLPVGLWLPWWIYCGFGVGGIIQAAALIFLVNLIPAVVGAALAAVVDQVGRFMMLTMILVAALLVFAMTAFVPDTSEPSLIVTRLLLGLVCLVVAALVAVAVQYRTRQVARSSSVLIAGIVALLLIRSWWPVDLLYSSGRSVSYRWNESPVALAGAEKISGRIWRAEAGSRNNKEGIAEPFINVRLGLAGVPEDVFVSGGFVTVELSWPDGTTVRRENLPVGFYNWSNRLRSLQHALGFSAKYDPKAKHWDPETREKIAAVTAEGQRRVAERNPGKKISRHELPEDLDVGMSWEIPVSPATLSKVRQVPPQCRFVAKLDTKRPVILGETPVVEGASIVRNGRMSLAKLLRSHIERSRREQVDVQYSGAITLVKPPFSPDSTFYLVDRTHETTGSGFSYNQFQGIPPLAGSLKYHPFAFLPPSLWRTDRWVELPDWQKIFTLVEEESRPAGKFSINLSVEELTLSDPLEE